MKNIIVPTDFSETANHALNFAIEFNEKIQGQITLVHVIELPSYAFAMTGEMGVVTPFDADKNQKEVRHNVNKKLAKYEELVRNAGQQVGSVIKTGNPYKSITTEIDDKEADWIIMGSKGASGIKEIVIGSNAERIVRHAKCPVFVIKRETHVAEMEEVVFGTDLSTHHDEIAEKACEIQHLLGMKMHVVKARTPYNFISNVEVIEKQLEEFSVRNECLKNYTLNCIEDDYIEDGIIKFAEEKGADMIIMGTHGRTGLSHLYSGSMTEDIVNHSSIPIVSLKITHH